MMLLFNLIAVVQILTEMLPISSSTHVLLATHFFAYFTHSSLPLLEQGFDYFLHGPTVLLLLIFFRHDWIRALQRLFVSRRFAVQKLYWQVLGHVVLATVLAEIFRRVVKTPLEQFGPQVQLVLLIGGLCVTMGLLVSLYFVPVQSRLRYGINATLFLVGLLQACAQLPGISRLASTYCVGVWLGLSPRRSLQLSFLYALPLMLAAFVVYGLPWACSAGSGFMTTGSFIASLVGASVIAYGLLRVLWRLALKRKMTWFALYLPIPLVAALLMGLGFAR